MCEGPESDLTLTENAQPAMMAVSLAVMRVLEKEGGVRHGRPGGLSWPVIRSANIPRLARPAPSRWPTPRGC